MPEGENPTAIPTPPGQEGAADPGTPSVSEETKQIIEKIEEVKTDITKTTDQLKEAVLTVATGAQGVDENAIKNMFGDSTKPGAGAPKPDPAGAADDIKNNSEEKKNPDIPAGASGADKQILEQLQVVRHDLKKTQDELAIKNQTDIDAKLLSDNKTRAEQALLIVKGKLALHEIEPDQVDAMYKETMELKDSRDDTKLADLKPISTIYASHVPEIETIPTGAAGDDYKISGTGTNKTSLKSIWEEMN